MLFRSSKKLLRAKIVLSFLIVGLIPVLVGLLITYWNGTLKLRESMGANFQGQAGEAARIIDLVLEGEIESKKHLSITPELRQAIEASNETYGGLSHQEIEERLSQLSTQWEEDKRFSLKGEALKGVSFDILRTYMSRRGTEYLAFFVTDEKGALVGSVNAFPGFIHGDEPWWKSAFNEGIGKTYIGELEFNEKAKVHVINISIPIFDGKRKRAVGVVTTLHDMRRDDLAGGLIRPTIQDIRFGKTGHAMLIDSTGQVLICPVMPSGSFIQDKKLISFLTSHEPGWVIADDDGHGGKNSIIGFSPISKTSELTKGVSNISWHSFIRQDPKELYAPLNSLLQSVAFSGIILIGFVALAGVVLSKKLARPIQILQEGAEEISRGNLDVKLDIRTNDEIEQLASQFNTMAEKLKESQATMEERVAERTRQLTGLNLIATTINRSLDLKEILEDTLEKVMELMQFHAGTIRLVDEKKEKLILWASKGVPLEIARDYHEISIGERLAGKVAALGQPIVIDGAQNTMEQDSPFLKIGMVSLVAIPLKLKEKILGTLSGGCRNPRSFSPQDLELLTSIGNQISVSVENAVLYNQTKEMVKELEISDRFKSEFFSNVSHEFRTPLTSIIGYSELLLGKICGDITPKQEEYITNIQASGNLLLENINNLLDLSRIRAGKMELNLGEFSIRIMIQNCLKAVRSLAAKKDQDLQCKFNNQKKDYSIDDGDLVIKGDEIKVKQILLNLLSNAIKFTPYGGSITIYAQTSTLEGVSAVEIIVADTGIGIKKEDQEKIFEEFKQADSSYTREYAGSGLGLTITKKYVEMHGGKISLESQAGEGSRFTILLPTGLERDQDIKLHESATEEEAATSAPLDPLTGFYNERYFSTFLQNLSFKSSIQKDELAFIMTRISHLKDYNQENGQSAGDQLIHKVGNIIRNNLRDCDLICRCYGSTFGIVMSGANKEMAATVGKKLRVVFAENPFPTSPVESKAVFTLSVVIASIPESPKDVESVFEDARRALDQVERDGGDHVLRI